MTEPRLIRLLVVDDNDMVRFSLANCIGTEDGLRVVGEAENGQRAVELCHQLQPDVVLMDLVMPEMDGVTAIRVIHKQHPHIVIVAVSSTIDNELIQAALEAGAATYVSKYAPYDTLIDAIHKVTNGHSP